MVNFAFFACEILRNCGIAGGFESLRERGFYFWDKPKVAKAFEILQFGLVFREILRKAQNLAKIKIKRIYKIWRRFCGIIESLVDFSLRGEAILLFAKAKRSKSFFSTDSTPFLFKKQLLKKTAT